MDQDPVLWAWLKIFSPLRAKRYQSRIFADDTNLFSSACNLKDLETLINSELEKVKEWCDVNKLSINFSKTNYMQGCQKVFK